MNALAPIALPAPPETAIDQLRAQGYVVVPGLGAPDTIAAIKEELAPILGATAPCQGDFYGWKTRRLGGVLTKAPTSQTLVMHPMILEILDAILGPHCDRYQLNLSQVVSIGPGEQAQPPHRDAEMYPCPALGHEVLINVMWALSPFTPDNGGTCLWPRSNHQAVTREQDLGPAVHAQLRPGDALVFLGSLVHGGGANRTILPRTGLLFSYCLGYLRQYENQYLCYPPDIARDFSPALRDLIGYRLHKPNLGCLEGADPARLFDPSAAPPGFVDQLTDPLLSEIAQVRARTAGI